eukprot:3160633-Rhodomonas_salina.1
MKNRRWILRIHSKGAPQDDGTRWTLGLAHHAGEDDCDVSTGHRIARPRADTFRPPDPNLLHLSSISRESMARAMMLSELNFLELTVSVLALRGCWSPCCTPSLLDVLIVLCARSPAV